VPVGSVAEKSNTPTSKSVVVSIEETGEGKIEREKGDGRKEKGEGEKGHDGERPGTVVSSCTGGRPCGGGGAVCPPYMTSCIVSPNITSTGGIGR
jgi:hypothetical protein